MTKTGNVYIGPKGKPSVAGLMTLLGVSTEGEAVRIVADEILTDAREMGVTRLTRRNIGIKTLTGAEKA